MRIVLLLLLLATRLSAAPVVIADNTGNVYDGSYSGNLFASTVLAESFVAVYNADLGNVTLFGAVLTAPATVSLRLYNSVPGGFYPAVGVPGTLLGTLTSPASLTGSPGANVFTAPPGLALTAGNTYWLALQATAGQFQWGGTSTKAGTGAGFLGDVADSSDGGTTWGNTPLVFASPGPFLMQVTQEVPAVGVPELESSGAPLALAFLATGLLILRGPRRCRVSL